MFTGCQSYKKVPYLQDAEVVLYDTRDAELYDAKIMPKDLLTIVVSCTSPELAAPTVYDWNSRTRYFSLMSQEGWRRS